MKKINFLSVLLFILSNGYSQPVMQWSKCLGGSDMDNAHCIQQTTDGGFIVAAEARSQNGDVTGLHTIAPLSSAQNPDYWIVKLDSIGNIQWQNCFGGGNTDVSYSVKQTKDGGYIVAGGTNSNDGDVTGFHTGAWDAWILKLNSAGVKQWQKCLGGTGGEIFFDIALTSDSGFVFAGQSSSNNFDVTNNLGQSDIWVVKTDKTGNLMWQKSYGGSSSDYGTSITPTNDNAFVIAGQSESSDGDFNNNFGSNDLCLLMIDSIGNLIWAKQYGGSDYDWGESIVNDNNNGFVVSGGTFSNNGMVSGYHGNSDYWIINVDSAGNLQWQKCLGGTIDDRSYSITKSNDGNFVCTGYAMSIDGDVTNSQGANDMWVVKIDPSGNMLWQQSYGETGTQQANSIIHTADGGYALAGIAFGNSGVLINNHSPGFGDSWIVKLAPDSITGVSELPGVNSNFSVYPNPVLSTLTFTNNKSGNIIITDVSGKIITSTFLNATVHSSSILDVSFLAPGLYFIKAGDRVAKFVKK